MLASFRRFAGTWPARVFFLVLVGSFATWGIADVVRNWGAGSGAVATVMGHDITPQQFAAEYQADLRRTTQRLPDPTQVPPQLRSQVARQTLQKLVTQEALAGQERQMGIVVPDAAVRQAVFAMQDFQGPDGKFSRPAFLAALANNNLSEARFLDLIRADIAQNQLLQTVAASAAPSELLTNLVFRYFNERRRADMLTLSLQGQRPPPDPGDAVLRRSYDNNPTLYSAPEYRRVNVVVLSPDSIGRSLTVPEADLHTWFDQHKDEYVTPEKRSLQVITGAPASIAALAARWRAGATWEQMQAAAKEAGATAIPLEDATLQEIPSPELAHAAFAAPTGPIVGPLTQKLGSYVLRVTAVTPARNPTFESLRPAIRAKAAAEKALDLIDARQQKLQDLFAGGAKIDELPTDLGIAGAVGTLDAQGLTPDGTPAPIPVAEAARQPVIDAAFKATKGEAIQLVEGPDHIWFAVNVESITPSARKPFAEVRARVLADWQREQLRHRQDTEATRILGLVKSGQTLQAAAWGSGLTVTRTPPLQRDRPAGAISAELAHTLFTLKLNEATMVETNDGFIVAQLSEILPPDAKADPLAMKQVQDGLAHALHDDYLQLYATAVRDAAHPVVRPQAIGAILAQPGE